MIRITRDPLDAAALLQDFSRDRLDTGAVVSFTGLTRGRTGDRAVDALTLEAYPGFTERVMEEIETEAHRRWPLDATLIIHRHGRLEPGEDIVLVIAASAHREAAFEACHFLIDWLKTKAPFWKLEENDGGASWVAAKDSDDDAARRWSR